MKLPPYMKQQRDENGNISIRVDCSTWIDVNERLPETDEEVLVWYEYYRYGKYNRMWQTYGLSQYIKQTEMWSSAGLGMKVKVLYWMPLPKPPENKE